MLWWFAASAALAAQPGAAGHGLSIAGEVIALTALPVTMGGATGLTLAAVDEPARYAKSPFVEISYVGVAMAGVGVPMTIAGAQIEAAALKKAGNPTPTTSQGDVGAWVTYGAAVATMAVGLPVAHMVIEDNHLAGPIVVGSTGLVSTTLWLVSTGLGAGYRGSLAGNETVQVNLVPTGNGLALAGRF